MYQDLWPIHIKKDGKCWLCSIATLIVNLHFQKLLNKKFINWADSSNSKNFTLVLTRIFFYFCQFFKTRKTFIRPPTIPSSTWPVASEVCCSIFAASGLELVWLWSSLLDKWNCRINEQSPPTNYLREIDDECYFLVV